MKRKDVVIMVIGISALVLMIVFKLIAGVSAFKTFGNEGGLDKIKGWFKENDGNFSIRIDDDLDLDLDDIIVIGDKDKVKIDEDGIHVRDGENTVDVEVGNIFVQNGEKRVVLDKDGIVVKSDDHGVEIDKHGIKVG